MQMQPERKEILLVVGQPDLALRMQKELPDNIKVVGYLAPLLGYSFDYIIFKMPHPSNHQWDRIDSWMHDEVMLKVKKGGSMQRI